VRASAEKQQEIVLMQSVRSVLQAAFRPEQPRVGILIAEGKRKTM